MVFNNYGFIIIKIYSNTMDKEIITLNIEGKNLQTSGALLKKFTYFESLIDRWSNSQNSIFVDCDYKLFKHMLNSVRIPNYIIPKKDLSNVNSLKNYFGEKNYNDASPSVIMRQMYFNDLHTCRTELSSVLDMLIYIPLCAKLRFDITRNANTIARIDNIFDIAKKIGGDNKYDKFVVRSKSLCLFEEPFYISGYSADSEFDNGSHYKYEVYMKILCYE
jgi:hypothetical protein